MTDLKDTRALHPDMLSFALIQLIGHKARCLPQHPNMSQDGDANEGPSHLARTETPLHGAVGRTPRLLMVTTDVLLLLTALRRQLVDMARRAGLEGWLIFTLVGWALSQFRRWLPYLNPFPSIARLCYFESLHPPEDASYTWLTSHWARCPRFQDRRSFITRTAVRKEHVYESDILTVRTPDEREARRRLQPSCEPLRLGETMYEWFRGTLISMRYGSVNHQNAEGIHSVDVVVVRCYTQHRGTLFLYLDQLKEEYERLRPAKISMRILDPHVQGFWESLPKRQKRRWSDIIISEDMKTQLKSSIGEFLSSQKWYGDRGLAWKTGTYEDEMSSLISESDRGLSYLCGSQASCYTGLLAAVRSHTALTLKPMYFAERCIYCSGKTSTIVGLASEFDLPVYILPLTSSIATDTLVASAIRILPHRAIILLEDIDAWAEQHAPRRFDEDEDDAESEDASVGASQKKTGGTGVILQAILPTPREQSRPESARRPPKRPYRRRKSFRAIRQSSSWPSPKLRRTWHRPLSAHRDATLLNHGTPTAMATEAAIVNGTAANVETETGTTIATGPAATLPSRSRAC